jgi:trimeric autotransporter adhesin
VKKKTSFITNSTSRSSRQCGRVAGLLIVIVLSCFAVLPEVHAQCQQGCSGTGNSNTVLGFDVLLNNTTGLDDTAVGSFALWQNTSGSQNTAIGSAALDFNTTGSQNTATGDAALYENTTGTQNTASGARALLSNTTGGANTATGFNALESNFSGSANTAIGVEALAFNTTGFNNTAIGAFALQVNTTGGANTATGFETLLNNTTGSSNTADGQESLFSNTMGLNNTAIGIQALWHNTTGINNIALGASAGSALTTGKNNIDIGNAGVAGEANKIRIGTTGVQKATFIAGISGVTVPSGVGVIVGTDGKLGTVVSSARFKDAIKPIDKASEAILALKPVTFVYKKAIDSKGIPQFGLVAEDVEKVNADLVTRDEQGKPYTVRYEAVNAMLLNEFLKEHRKVEQLETALRAVNARLAKQDAKIQKVSARLELSKPPTQTVLNNP